MSRSDTFVVVGGGLAGAKTAEALRDNDFDGHIRIFTQEERLPYDRPPLSKEFLAGTKTLADVTLHDAAWYRDHDIELQLGTEVIRIEPGQHTVTLPDDEAVSYNKLLLATGSRSRRPRLPGADATGVHYLRTVEESQALQDALTEGTTLAIVGAGWIGLEVAANARARGVAVTVVETAALPLLAALGPEVAEVFAQLHRDHGVDLRLSCGVAEISTTDGVATGVRFDDGSTVAADAVLVAVGAVPNVGLAEAAGLELAAGGVAVDSALRTSNPDIFAVGDIAAAQNTLLDTRIRTEHWANALKQPGVAALGMLGRSAEYAELPYFFTDQYDLGMEYVGHGAGYQRVVFRGDPGTREFTVFWLDGEDRVLAGMNVNIWSGLDDIKALIRARRPVDSTALADPAAALAEAAR